MILAIVLALAVTLVACGNGTNTDIDTNAPSDDSSNSQDGQSTAPDDSTNQPDGLPEAPGDEGAIETPENDDDTDDLPAEEEDGAWWTYSENYNGFAKSFLRFYSDTEWEVELLKDCMFAQMSVGSLKWATGDYYFEEVEGTAFGNLYIRLYPTFWDDTTESEIERTNVALLDKDNNAIENGTWVEYNANEDGYFIIRLAFGPLTSSPEDVRYLEWEFKPSSSTKPAYYFEDEQLFLDSLGTVTAAV